jgi:hypothetical protein
MMNSCEEDYTHWYQPTISRPSDATKAKEGIYQNRKWKFTLEFQGGGAGAKTLPKREELLKWRGAGRSTRSWFGSQEPPTTIT